MRILGIVALGAALTGCVTNNETVQFKTSNPQQQAMMRDGQPAIVLRQKSSIVLVRPASRQLQANGRRYSLLASTISVEDQSISASPTSMPISVSEDRNMRCGW
jgi:hypothetical protein